jgi:hypothetical protein
MHQQIWGYKVEEKLYVGVHEQKRLNITVLIHQVFLALVGTHPQNISQEAATVVQQCQHDL